jgi:hypothetical protein
MQLSIKTGIYGRMRNEMTSFVGLVHQDLEELESNNLDGAPISELEISNPLCKQSKT